MGFSSCLTLLLQAGADMNARILSGFTPLHIAAEFQHELCVAALLSAGADPAALSTPASARQGGTFLLCPAPATAAEITFHPALRQLLARAELAARLEPLMAAATRGALFGGPLFDARLWRLVGRYALLPPPPPPPLASDASESSDGSDAEEARE
jgi:hypothetical protein